MSYGDVKLLFLKSTFLKSVFRKLANRIPIVLLSELTKRSQNPYSESDIITNVIFIHIPKTAGSSIVRSVFEMDHHGHFRPEHYIGHNKELFNLSKKVCVVRNPWDRFVSAYHYLKQDVGGGPYGTRFSKEVLGNISSFSDFCDKMEKDLKFRKKVLLWDHFRPQWDFISYGGDVCVDLIGRFENLDIFMKELYLLLGRKDEPILNKTNSSFRERYNEYYDETSQKLVAEIYKDEIDYLGYQFDEC